MKKLFYCTLLAGMLSATSFADVATKDAKGYSVGDLKWETIATLTEAATKGDPLAMYVLAWAYDEGNGIEENESIAEDWYEKATPGVQKKAESGDVNAMVILGEMYDEGNGVAKSKKKSAQWYQKAADKGNVIAIYELAECYDDGDGVPKDKDKAQELYKAAAAKGHAKAAAKVK